jgi:hypothetical protein
MRGRAVVGGLMLVCVTGCGSTSDGATVVRPAETAADTTTTVTAPTTSSPPPAAPTGYDAVNDAIPAARFDGESVDVSAPYFGSQDVSGGAASPVDGFVPSSDDQEFCWAIEVINARPQPRDEFQEIVVADEYFSAIRPFAVAAVASELDVLIGYTNTIVSHGSFTESDEVDSGASAAVEAINAFVDERCLGLLATTESPTAIDDCGRLFRMGDVVFDDVTSTSPRYWSPTPRVAYIESSSDPEPVYLLPLPTVDAGPPLAELSDVSMGSGETGVIGTIEGEPVARIAVSDQRCPTVLIFGPASRGDLAVIVSQISFSTD